MKSTAIAIFAGLGICVAAGTAGATVFQIDEFKVTENTTTYWLDSFSDGAPPINGDGTVDTNPYERAYLTSPLPKLPGPETGGPEPDTRGKLAMDTAEGFLNIGVVTPVFNKIQRARVNSYTSSTAPQDGKLTEGDNIVVSALYDLIEPQQNTEYYGIRVTDWANNIQGEGLRLAVRKNLSGVWEVVFSQAEIGVAWNTIESWTLTDITDIGDYDQIALSLFNDPQANGDMFSAEFTLTDLALVDTLSPMTFMSDAAKLGSMFQVSDWLRPEFLAGVRVSEPAVLSLFALGLAGIGYRRRKQIKAA